MPLASLLNRVLPGQGVLVWDMYTQLVVLNTAPKLRKQPSVTTMNQPNLYPLNLSTPSSALLQAA